MFYILKLLLIVRCFILCHAIVLRNGGYEDVHIVIQDKQPENDRLLQRIKEIFTQASQLLFIASRNQVYFRKIKIIIPRSWVRKPALKQIPALALKRGYITVSPGKNQDPHVNGLTECGGEGIYMYLPSEFILEEGYTTWGDHANVIVHEWGHFRWGLFDEYAYVDRGQPAFYLTPTGWKPAVCTETVKGRVYINRGSSAKLCDTINTEKKMDPACQFMANVGQSVNASLMGYGYVKALTMFCDQGDDVHESQRHNQQASTNHNIKCDGQSAWNVMRKHSDFTKNNGVLPSSTSTTPEFEIQQETHSTRVFVFDVSGSMQGEKIQILQQTAKHVIESILPLNSSLGIVTFNSAAQTVKRVTDIRTQKDRDDLAAAVPSTANGGTCIGCGVKEGIMLLTSHLGSPENGEIILVSDGETGDADKKAAIQDARSAKVTVHTVAVTQKADALLEEIASQTGGVHVAYLEIGSISFAAAFTEAISKGVTSASSVSITLLSEKVVSAIENNISFQFVVDEDAGKDTSITIMTRSQQTMSIFLTGPDNYQQNFSTVGNTASMKIPGIAKAGEYHVEVVGLLKHQGIDYFVNCYPTDSDPIQITTKLSNIHVNFTTGQLPVVYGLLSKGYLPVFNASVEAKIEAQTRSCIIGLQDNGQDPDTVMNDGTYSGYVLPSCLGEGRVAVKVYASGDAGAARFSNNIPGAPSLNRTYFETKLGSFQRVTIAQNFLVTNYVDKGTADTVEPGRITDVQLYHITTRSTPYGESRNFTITWTATGDDKSVGQASAYEMKISNSFDTLLNNFAAAENLDMPNVTFIPQPSGETEALRIVIDAEKSYTESAFFAVRAIDEVGNVGPVSNIVQIIVAKGYRASGSTGSTDFEDESDAQSGEKNNKTKTIIIVVATILAAVVLFIVVFVVVRIFVARRSKERYSSVTQVALETKS